jgi:hypothetical protein
MLGTIGQPPLSRTPYFVILASYPYYASNITYTTCFGTSCYNIIQTNHITPS